MMDDLNYLGLCKGYKVMLEYSTSVGNSEISYYRDQDIVCPFKLRKGIVTTIAVDNIDQSTSSMTA